MVKNIKVKEHPHSADFQCATFDYFLGLRKRRAVYAYFKAIPKEAWLIAFK